MADFGVTEGLVIQGVIAAAAAGTSAYAANQAAQRQNRVAKAVAKSTEDAARVESEQLKRQAAFEKQKAVRNAERVRARIRVAAAAAGFDDIGSYAAFERQADYDTALNTTVLDQNLAASLRRTRSGLDASLAEVGGRMVSPILAGFTGGIQGAQSGLAISSLAGSGGAAQQPGAATTGTEADFFASGRQVYNADREYQIP